MYESHPDREEFSRQEYSAYVTSQVGHNDVIASLLVQIVEADVGDDILLDLVTEARKRALAVDVALLAVDVSEGRRSLDDLLCKVDEFDEAEKIEEEIEFVTDDLEELHEHNVTKQGIRWRLNTLNYMLGSLRKGDFGFIFARPESGKTTFLASEVSYFAGQVPTPILWFNNEEVGERVQIRILQATLGLTIDQLFSDLKRNKQRYYELTGGRIKIVDSASITKRDVDRICERVQPSLIVFDQIDKVKGFDNDREDLRLGSIYIWARELAKTYAPVIGVTQSDGTGEGQKWLTMANVANAKTAKQAEADWILGIGKSSNEGFEYIRHLHLSKNKLTGDSDTIPELRHGRRDVVIKAEIARYEDVK